jgi:ribosomal protein S11
MCTLFCLTSCTKEDPNGPISGTPIDQGKAGTTVIASGTMPGVTSASAKVLSVENGVSNVEMTAVVTSPVLKALAQLQSAYCTVKGDTVVGHFGVRLTSEGVQLVTGGKNSTIVNFSDGVGTVYTSEVSGRKHTIVAKSTTDDYPYAFYNIKVSKVEESISVGGSIVKIYFFANHKFGLVGIEIVFEDGSKISTTLI